MPSPFTSFELFRIGINCKHLYLWLVFLMVVVFVSQRKLTRTGTRNRKLTLCALRGGRIVASLFDRAGFIQFQG